MAQVPYKPFPDQSPADIPTPRISIRTPEDAFGIGIAKAVQGLGETEGKVGDELFTRAIALQQLQNETSALNGATDFSKGVAKLQSEFDAKGGAAAGPDALEKHLADMDDLRNQIRARMPNDMVRKMYDEHSFSFLNRNIFSSARHSADETKKYHIDSVVEAKKDRIDELGRNSDDPGAIPQFKADMGPLIEREGSIKGWDDKEKEFHFNDAVKQGLANFYVNRAHTLPMSAIKEVMADKAALGDKYDQVLNTVVARAHLTIADNISKQVNAEIGDEPLEAKMTRAEQLLKDNWGDVPEQAYLERAVKQQVRYDYGNQKAEHADAQRGYSQTLFDWIVDKKPQNLREIDADPKVSAAFDSLDPKAKLEFRAQFQRYHDQANLQTSIDARHRLEGLAADDPHAFLGVDLTKEQLNQKDVDKLNGLKKSIMKDEQRDPRVAAAMNTLQNNGILARANIDKTQDADRYHIFYGALQDAMLEWKDSHNGKMPNTDEIMNIGKQLTYETTPKSWWFGHQYKFEQQRDMDDKDIEEKRQQMIQDNPSVFPSNEDIIREVARQRFRKAIEDAKSKPPRP